MSRRATMPSKSPVNGLSITPLSSPGTTGHAAAGGSATALVADWPAPAGGAAPDVSFDDGCPHPVTAASTTDATANRRLIPSARRVIEVHRDWEIRAPPRGSRLRRNYRECTRAATPRFRITL